MEYDGTEFSGFQSQLDHRTVQGELERAVSKVAVKDRIVIHGSGRTDAGVHALGQVIAFNMEWRHTEDDLLRAINAYLPQDIVLRTLGLTSYDFNPRRCARWRSYQYRIYNAPIRSPLHMRTSWHVKAKLDLGAMRSGAECLVGEHDFASFGRSPNKIGTTTRRVSKLDWREDKYHFIMEIVANAFLYRMVRSIVGTLYMVGVGSWESGVVEEVLHAKDRNKSGPLAPPQGLTLTNIEF